MSKQPISRSNPFVLINGIIPTIGILFFGLFTSDAIFIRGYFLYGWTEVFALSSFVSFVPDVAQWFLFGISLVGAEATANVTITLLILFGGIFLLIGWLVNLQANQYASTKMKGRTLWLIGGILTFPLGILALIAYRNTRQTDNDLSLKDRFLGEIRKNKLPYILIIPAIFFLLFTYIIPILRGFYITLFSYPIGNLSRAFRPVDYSTDPLLWTLHAIFGGLQFQDPIFTGLDNYLELFSHTTRATSFQNALDNNVFFVILFVPGVIILSLGLALLLNNKLLKGENTYTTIFYLPVITSVLVVSVIWLRVVFPANGLLTIIFTLFAPIHDFLFVVLNFLTFGIVPANVVGTNLNWLSFALIESVALMSIWRSVGFDVLILLAGLKSIPSSLYEAADIDGHGSWSKFRNITLPMLKGPLGVVIILELINGWQIFQEFFGLNIAQFGGDQSLAIYLIANYADPSVMSFASAVGYFIFGMTAFIGLLGRVEIKNLLKGFSLFILLAVLFLIPANRSGVDPKSLGFTVSWMTYDIMFLALAFLCLLYYILYSLLRDKQLENDGRDLRVTGYFMLFVIPFFLLNGYNVITQTGAGSKAFNIMNIFIPSGILGMFLLIIAILMILAPNITIFLKNRKLTPFLFSNEEEIHGGKI